jgi:hypothetical protein
MVISFLGLRQEELLAGGRRRPRRTEEAAMAKLTGQVRSGQVRSGQVRSGQARSGANGDIFCASLPYCHRVLRGLKLLLLL